jgi:hypothetical protein
MFRFCRNSVRRGGPPCVGDPVEDRGSVLPRSESESDVGVAEGELEILGMMMIVGSPVKWRL